jgi:hypothetical protein
MTDKRKWYVGHANGGQWAFAAYRMPTAITFPQFNAVVGPFHTKRAAKWAATQRNNPHFQSVADAERIAGQTEIDAKIEALRGAL